MPRAPVLFSPATVARERSSVSSQAADTGAGHAPALCENCATALQGEFCHACGQSVHNPIRHLGHAVEEFFEAFWHLDGRVFRTLRDLMVPGRVAASYLAGHRARYIAPLRLFVILAVLTFFIGATAIHVDDDTLQIDGIEEIGTATSVEQVRRLEETMLARIDEARVGADGVPIVGPGLIQAEVRIRAAAANRIVELEGTGADGVAAAAPVEADTTEGQRGSRSRPLQLNILGHKGVWHPRDNPFTVGWWPDFANAWLNRKLGNLDRNMQALDDFSPEAAVQAIMAAAPSALFLLVPVFAVLLKVAYLFSRRVYLEHLVVALYSHAFLLIMLTLAFLLSAAGSWTSGLPSILFNTCFAAVLLWMPLYLLLMQKRVYGQPWWLTVPKFVVVGNIYFVLLAFAALLVFLARLAS